jgi:hypothetical protein
MRGRNIFCSISDPVPMLSRILIFFFIYPGHQIPDPTKTKKGEGKIVVLPIFVAINFTLMKFILFLNRYRKIKSQLTKNLCIFSPKNYY